MQTTHSSTLKAEYDAARYSKRETETSPPPQHNTNLKNKEVFSFSAL